MQNLVCHDEITKLPTFDDEITKLYCLQNRLKSNLIFLLILHVMQWDQAIEISLEIFKNSNCKGHKI